MMGAPTLAEVSNKRLPIISADQSLSKAAEVMLANNTLGVVVCDVKRRPMLVLSYRGLVRAIARGAHHQARVSEYAVDEPVVARADMSAIEALSLMRRESIRFLPVVDARNRLVGVFEPRNAVEALWELLDYGDATIQARLRKLVALPGDATVRVAAKAMDENGVPEILVRVGDELRIFREEDFLRALAEENVDEAKIGDYARGKVIMAPPLFDAKSAVELMLENNVGRLLVEVDGRTTTITLTDLAFEAGSLLEKKTPVEVGFVLVRTEPGRESDIAEKVIMADGVREVHLVAGAYDMLVRVEASTIRDIHRIVRDEIRRLPGVLETLTLTGFRVAGKKE
ncbi:MAG: CBS domain-containing protein [Desulfurococcales archaeon]|nr:CBS domain-containing protein [Desulfurococcales archaeon]